MLIKLVWRARCTTSVPSSELSPSSSPSDAHLVEKEKEGSSGPIVIVDKGYVDRGANPETKSFWKLFSWRSTRSEHEKDMERVAPKQRQTRLIAPFYNGLGCALAICKYLLRLRCSTDATFFSLYR
jgi:hypothetical protein